MPFFEVAFFEARFSSEGELRFGSGVVAEVIASPLSLFLGLHLK